MQGVVAFAAFCSLIGRLVRGIQIRPTMLFLAPLVLTVLALLSTALNPKNQSQDYLGYFLGYLPLSVLPFLAGQSIKWQQPWTKLLFRWASIAFFIWGGIVASQFIWGWSLRNPSGGVDFRPFGFYSHPLTLAYVSLLLWPIQLARLAQDLRLTSSWLGLVGLLVILITTQSRACQAVALLITTVFLFLKLKGRGRIISFFALTAFVLGIALTSNPVSDRFALLLNPENPDRFSDYPDDRVAFWHAHWEMIKERPVLGHGIHLNHRYRIPYYESIGLEDFVRQYEAHNQLIQITANAGVFGLFLFLCWIYCLLKLSREIDPEYRLGWVLCILGFVLAGLVQNAYSDGEVRHTLTVLLCISMVALKKQVKKANYEPATILTPPDLVKPSADEKLAARSRENFPA